MTLKTKQAIHFLLSGFILMGLSSCSSDDNASKAVFSEDYTTRLFMVSGKEGTLEFAENDNQYTITLHQVSRDMLWITDRPERKSGTVETEEFTAHIWDTSFRQTAPNAVLKFLLDNENAGLFVTLREPLYDPEKGTLSFKATLIRSTLKDGDPRLTEVSNVYDPSIVILNNGEGINYVVHSDTARLDGSGQGNPFTLFQEGIDDRILWASSAPSTFSEVTTARTFANDWDAMFSEVPPNAFILGMTAAGEMKAFSVTLESIKYFSEGMVIAYTATALENGPTEDVTLETVSLVIDSQETAITIQFDNRILAADGGPCSPWTTETVTVFLPGQNPGGIQLAPNSKSDPYPISTGSVNGAGIQVNFWYWCREPDVPVGPADGNKPQNPDNSGGQFIFTADCSFEKKPAVFGQGIETYEIADVSSAMKDGICVVTIEKNPYTGCVTPNCCSPSDGGVCPDEKPREYACADPPQ